MIFLRNKIIVAVPRLYLAIFMITNKLVCCCCLCVKKSSYTLLETSIFCLFVCFPKYLVRIDSHRSEMSVFVVCFGPECGTCCYSAIPTSLVILFVTALLSVLTCMFPHIELAYLASFYFFRLYSMIRFV